MSLPNLLKSVLKNPREGQALADLQEEVRLANFAKSKAIAKFLRRAIKSKKNSPSEKLQVLRIFVFCMDTGNPLVHRAASHKLLPRLARLAASKDQPLFKSVSPVERHAADSFAKLLLASI